jgi:hypothetical protein
MNDDEKRYVDLTDTISEEDISNLADIAWWIKGYMAADEPESPFCEFHVRSLRKAIVCFKKEIRGGGNHE